MLIRPMSEADAAAIALVNRDMRYQASAEQIVQRFQTIAAMPGNALFVAEREGVVLGWAHARVVSLLQSEPYVSLASVMLRQQAKRERVGAALIDACRRWAQDLGYADVLLP
jgi:predicted N-acetyltransferase YhbS